ncbi:hypothetical protein B0H21DRAFT_696664 [Amylocystis lapponica]|nr:hypothetical protein B0H21DRAFT_696664 [Amylocystis lapponica]
MQAGYLVRLGLVVLGFCVFGLAAAQLNVTLLDTAPEITFSPPACSDTLQSANCPSAWQIIPSPDDAGSTIASTSGPTNGSGQLIPQFFLAFRGIALYIQTSNSSNATANVTLTTSDPMSAITTEVDTGIVGPIAIVDLPEDRVTTLAVTASSPFVTTTFPVPTALSSFLPISSSSPTAQARLKAQTKGDIAAEVLGTVLGTILIGLGAVALVYFWTRRRRADEAEK